MSTFFNPLVRTFPMNQKIVRFGGDNVMKHDQDRLSYIQAQVYHDREEPERDGLREMILNSVSTDECRREVETMFRSGADALREEGRVEGAISALQDGIVELVRTKFGRVPRATQRAIRATRDQDELRALLVRAGKAESIEEIGVAP